MKKLKVGQKLWFVPSYGRRAKPYEVEVVKVGRKWAYINGRRRIHIESLVVDGGDYQSPGCCYLSKEEHEYEVLFDRTLEKFKDKVKFLYAKS